MKYTKDLIVTSGTNTYTGGLVTKQSALNPGIYFVQFANANTSAVTLNIDSLGAIAIVDAERNALLSGDLPAGKMQQLFYDGTNFIAMGVTSGSPTSDTNLGSTDLTSSSAARTFTLHGTASTDKLTISDGTNTVAVFRGDGKVGIGTSSPAAKLDVSGTVKITDGTQGANKVLTSDASGNATWQTPAAPTLEQTYEFSMLAAASGTIGTFAKALATGALPSTDPYTTGINNTGNDPYRVAKASTVTKVGITFAHAGVQAASVGSSPVIRLELFKLGYSTRTSIGTYDITISNTGVGTWDNLAGNAFQTAELSGLSTALSAGDLIGIQFTNLSTNNNKVDALSNAFVTVVTTIN